MQSSIQGPIAVIRATPSSRNSPSSGSWIGVRTSMIRAGRVIDGVVHIGSFIGV